MGRLIPFPSRRSEPYRWFCSTCGRERDDGPDGLLEPCAFCGTTMRQTWPPPAGGGSVGEGFFGVRLRP